MGLKLTHFLSIRGNEIAQRWVVSLFKLSEKIIHAPQGGSVSVESPQNYLWLDLFFQDSCAKILTVALSVEVHNCGLSYPQQWRALITSEFVIKSE